MNHILIVDDDKASCRTLQLHLRSQGYYASAAHSVDDGLATAEKSSPGLIILDIRMPGKDGLEGLLDFKNIYPDTPVIMITAFHDMESTIQAMKNGADDYIHKPVDIHELDEAIRKAFLQQQSREYEMSLPDDADSRHGINTMVGNSRAMKEVFKTIGLIAPKPVTVLITGESGTGKGLVARTIHNAGIHPYGPFVSVNCAAMSESQLETELFGLADGISSGIANQNRGKFSLANEGTIFLGEIGELPMTIQAKLLRVLQDSEYMPVGANHAVRTGARIIASTNSDLAEKVKQGKFRENLYYRLQIATIALPPLRNRKSDILDLVQTLLVKINADMERKVDRLSMEVINAFQNYDWPGNIRELQNVLIKAVTLCTGDIITRDLIPAYFFEQERNGNADGIPIAETSLDEMEKIHVSRVLEATGWHRGKACAILGISRPRLRRIIRQHNLVQPEDVQDEEDVPVVQ